MTNYSQIVLTTDLSPTRLVRHKYGPGETVYEKQSCASRRISFESIISLSTQQILDDNELQIKLDYFKM